MPENSVTVSIVVLTYSRPEEIRKNVEGLLGLSHPGIEVIVVDNASAQPVAGRLPADPRLRVITLQENIGVGGRNVGISSARGEIVITLDDDVTGLTDAAIHSVVTEFLDPDVGAVNFMVLDEQTGQLTNWCHHRKQLDYSNQRFETYEISEGAVAFRRKIVIDAGLYPELFFISHEGPDLAIRIMDLGYKVIYSPAISVKHSHCQVARADWRRYYYDTRNLIWYVVRSFPVFTGMKKILIGACSMCFYSIRDGYFRYWLKGIYDGIKSLRQVLHDRKRISAATMARYREIEKHNPGIWYMVRKRLFEREVRI